MGPDQEFMLSRFRRYYRANRPEQPSRLERREFGFMFYDRDFVQRHIGFQGIDSLSSYLANETPAHSYYSTAYYRYPMAPTMAEKGWLGADLIFDLDADHMPGVSELSYGGMMERIKEELIKLVDDFLTGDLGMSASDLKLAFSGGRGYHVHVSDARLSSLKSHERREIVDYLKGTGLDMDRAFPSKTVNVNEFKGRVQESRVRKMPGPDAKGWRGRARSAAAMLVEDLRGRSLEDVRQRYPSAAGSPDGVVKGMLRDLHGERGSSTGGAMMLNNSVLDCFSDIRHETLFLRMVEDDARPRLTPEIDEPVTADIKRLIRLPGSLHGKTGLRVTILTRDEVDSFDPLRDAVPEEWTDRPVTLYSKGRVEIDIKGQRFAFDGRSEVPEYAAMFMIGRRMASIEPPADLP